jgi:hypothetical protein
MAVTYSPMASNTVQVPYDATWNSLYNTMLEPQIWPELYQKFGYLPGLFDFLHFSGQEKDIKGSSMKTFEEGSIEKPIKLGSAISTGNAGAYISITLDSTEYDANDSYYLRVGDDVIIPSKYQPTGVKEPRRYRVQSKSGSAESITFLAYPSTAAGTTYTASQISTEIPSGTYLAVSPGSYAPGSQGAVARSRGWYERNFYTDIKRAAVHIEGSIQSDERYYEKLKGGGTGALNKATMEADFELNAAINDALFLSENNDNTSLVLANRNSTNNAIRSTMGTWNWLEALGMEQSYVSSYTMDDFDLLRDYFDSQGVTAKDATFFVGSDLRRNIENAAGLEFLREFSGGTDLTSANGGMMKNIGINVGSITKNSIRTLIFGLNSLSNVNKFGVDSLWFKQAGFIVPQQDVTVKGFDSVDGTVKMRNMCLGYKNYNGENRTRITVPVAGVNGMNFPATDTYDDIRFEMLSEFMFLFHKVNQCVKVIPSTVT